MAPVAVGPSDVLELEGADLGDPAGSRDTRLPMGWSPELKEVAPVLELGHSNRCSIVKAFLFFFFSPLDLSKIDVREKNKIQTTKPSQGCQQPSGEVRGFSNS